MRSPSAFSTRTNDSFNAIGQRKAKRMDELDVVAEKTRSLQANQSSEASYSRVFLREGYHKKAQHSLASSAYRRWSLSPPPRGCHKTTPFPNASQASRKKNRGEELFIPGSGGDASNCIPSLWSSSEAFLQL